MARFFASCVSDMDAKNLAHAIHMEGARQLAVWGGQRLLYTRPLSGDWSQAPVYEPMTFTQLAFAAR